MLSDALPLARNTQPCYQTRQFPVSTFTGWMLCFALLFACSAASSASTSGETATQGAPTGRGLRLSGTLPAAEVGVTFNGALNVSGGTAPYTFSISWGELPPGLALSAKSGTISGQPTKSGTYNFGVHVTDSSDEGTGHAFAIIVAKAPSIVVTVTPATATVASGASTQFTALVTNTTNVAVTWSASSGTISSTGLYAAPTVSANTTVTVTATSVADTTKSATASVTVTPPPINITTTSLPNATGGIGYSNTLTATGGTIPFTWTLFSGSLPSGITVQSAGSVSGTTSQTGQFNITVEVMDSASPKQTSTQPLTLTVVAPVAVTVTPTTATVASGGTEQFTAFVSNASNAAVTWSASLGTISSAGLYSAPTVSANSTFNVTATSVADTTKSATASVTVTPPPPPPVVISTTSLSNPTAGSAYSSTLTATGGKTPYTWTLSSGSLPPGITLQPAGSLSGTTVKTGQFNITVEVTDSSSPQQTSSEPFTLTVNSAIGTGPTPPASYFGFSWNYTNSGTWPGQSYGMQRFWDSPATQWPDINTAWGVFDFAKLDSDLALAYTKGTMQGMYTLARTPPWATSNPTDTSCNDTTGMGGGDGECDAPSDLNSDGSGTNSIWKAFITAIATHVNDPTYLQIHAHIKYWEIWNEPDTQAFFAGTIAQLARLTEDANCIITGRGVIHQNGNGTATSCTATPIDPTAQIVMASAHAKGTALKYGQNELYCNSSPKTYQLPCPNPPNAIATAVDIINFHMKPGNETGNNCPAPTPCTPESAMQMYASNIRGMLQPAELAKPLWDGEAQYSTSGFSGDYLSDTDLAASFMPRFYLINWTLNISGMAWYTANSQAEPVEAQTSYQQTYNWLSGAILSTPCAATGTVWSCGITISGNPYLILWDTSQTCANNSCSTAIQTVAPQWTQYQDMTAASNPITISGGVVPVGIKPVLLN